MELAISPVTVFLFALITALATGIGALPLLFMRQPSARTMALSSALAAGLMAGASWGLIQEGIALGLERTLFGVVLGVIFIWVSHGWLDEREVSWGTLSARDAKRVILVVGAMTLHSFAEGVGVGVSFGGGEALGLFITIAIAIHNVPEGLAIALTMVPRGASVWKAAGWGIFSSLPQPLMAVPAFLFVSLFTPFLPVGLGFAAGAMGWMIVSEMLPEAREHASMRAVVVVTLLSAGVMIGIQALL
jgi:zinc transporter, ZIP family